MAPTVDLSDEEFTAVQELVQEAVDTSQRNQGEFDEGTPDRQAEDEALEKYSKLQAHLNALSNGGSGTIV